MADSNVLYLIRGIAKSPEDSFEMVARGREEADVAFEDARTSPVAVRVEMFMIIGMKLVQSI